MSVRYSIKNNTGSVISVVDTDHPITKHKFIPTGSSTLLVPDEEVPAISAQLTALGTQFGVNFVVVTQTLSNGQLVSLGAPAAQGTTNVHAAVASNAANAFPGPITNPVPPRNVRCVFQAAYDGGDITVVGTDQFNAAQTEVIPDTAGATVAGVKIWKTITSITKEAVGATANTVSVGTGNKLGIPVDITAAQVFVDGIAEAATVDTTVDGVTATTATDGVKVFSALVNSNVA